MFNEDQVIKPSCDDLAYMWKKLTKYHTKLKKNEDNLKIRFINLEKI